MAVTSSAAPDVSLWSELFEEIERNPPAIEARKILIQQYATVGWIEAASDAVQELLLLDPTDSEAIAWALEYELSKPRIVRKPKPSKALPPLPADLDPSRAELCREFDALRTRAKDLEQDARLVRDLERSRGSKTDCGRLLPVLQALAEGQITSVLGMRPPKSARTVAKTMCLDSSRALDIAIDDLSNMARSSNALDGSVFANEDSIRQGLMKRVIALEASLSESLQSIPLTALMHVEHEVLKRTYLVSETMLGDPISDIPRSKFLVTEDGYPWDMEELVQALVSNGGVMRNPLSREMFTPKDVCTIVQHPLGKPLAALKVAQSRMIHGIRPKTVGELQRLASCLLADQSEDQAASRLAVDAFMVYIATLPAAEQKAIDLLRVPAKDKHTGQAFDTSIGDAVRDAKANRTCFHKAGDLIDQAAIYLKRQQK